MLRIHELSKRFDGVDALSGLSFETSPGDVVGLLGPNGSGKTTVLNILSRLVEPDAGSVLLRGSNLLAFQSSDMARQGVARLFQTPRLCRSLTVAENIAMGACSLQHRCSYLRSWRRSTMARQAVFEAMGRWGLTEKSTVYPAALSFFEERKVELARMQVIHPTLILLDEPSSGFSQSERDELTAALRVFASPQVIVLLVEHDLTMVRTMCNKVVVLNGGRKIVEGHPNVVESLREVRSVLLGAGDNAACA